jgi:hypothetical protein
MSRFRQRIGPERLERIMKTIVVKLRDAGVIKGEIIVCNAFIKDTASEIQTRTKRGMHQSLSRKP